MARLHVFGMPLNAARRMTAGAVLAFPLWGCQGPEPFHRPPVVGSGTPVTCQISRAECDAIPPPSSTGGGLSCSGFPLLPFVATTCSRPEDGDDPVKTCTRAFCAHEATAPYGFDRCNVDHAENANLPAIGVCSSNGSANGRSQVSFFQRSRACDPALDSCSVVTDTGTRCVDVATMPAITTLMPPSDNFLRSVEIIQYQAESSQCTASAQSSNLTYALPPGPLGTATGAGMRADVSLVNGFAKFRRVCDVDGGCGVTQLDDLRMNVANLTVSGVPLTNVVIKTASTTPLSTVSDGESQRPGIAPGKLKLLVDGQIAGQRLLYALENRSSVAVDTGATALGILGTLDVMGRDLSGRLVPVSFGVNVQGRPANAAEQACAAASETERVFGFESAESWSSSQAALSEATSPLTQGCGALSVSGQGYMTLNGSPFSTQRVGPQSSLSVDLFIPDHQPNPYWLGALQMFLSCPSGNVFNQYIGQVELTGKPQNTYSTLRFPLPSAIATALAQPLDDCSFSLALNVNATGQSWFLDNLRFTP